MEATALSVQAVNEDIKMSAPINKKDRILFLDCIRGIALLGILIMNIMSQSQPHVFYDTLNLDQPITGPNFWAWVIECLFFEGTMRGLFSILFGAGTLLLLNRLQKQHSGLLPADIYYRRLLWLLVFGLINAFVFLWPGDILYPYAVCGLLLFPFRNWSAKKLLLGALLFLAIGTYRENSMLYDQKKIITEGRAVEQLEAKKIKLNESQQEALGKWKGYKEKNTSQGIMKRAKDETRKLQGQSYYSIFKYYLDVNMMLESTAFYKTFWWDILLCFFVGMALFKSHFLQGEKSTALYAAIALVGIGVGLVLNYFMLRLQYNSRFDSVVIMDKAKISYYEIRRLFQTVGYLSLLILLYKLAPFKKILQIFAPVGQMAFTNYLMQSIITSVIFYGFAVYGKLQRYEVYYILLSIWAFQIAFSHIWLRYFQFGPFEWVWRSLTYGYKPVMSKRRIEVKEAIMPELATT